MYIVVIIFSKNLITYTLLHCICNKLLSLTINSHDKKKSIFFINLYVLKNIFILKHCYNIIHVNRDQ